MFCGPSKSLHLASLEGVSLNLHCSIFIRVIGKSAALSFCISYIVSLRKPYLSDPLFKGTKRLSLRLHSETS